MWLEKVQMAQRLQWKKGLSAALWNDSSWSWSGETWTSFAIEWIAYNQFMKRRQANAICGLDHSTQLSRGVRFWVNVYMWDSVYYCNSVAHGFHMHIQVHLKSCTKIRLYLDHSYSILTYMQMLATAMRLHLLQPLLPSHCPKFCWIAMGNTTLRVVVSTLLSVSLQVEKPQLAHTWQRTYLQPCQRNLRMQEQIFQHYSISGVVQLQSKIKTMENFSFNSETSIGYEVF